MRNILLYFSIKYMGDWDKIYQALNNKEDVNFSDLKKWEKEYKDKYISILDDEYPKDLKSLAKPPFVIYYKGNIELLKLKKIIWPFGSINNKQIKDRAFEMRMNEIPLVLGYSDHIEKELLNYVEFNNAIIVKDGGINNTLIITKEQEDKIIENEGLIISEYPGNVIPTLSTWKESNKIKIGLAYGVFLINSLKVKSLFTILSQTLSEGKDIFCLKSSKDEENHNNVLIEKGAIEIISIADLRKQNRKFIEQQNISRNN